MQNKFYYMCRYCKVRFTPFISTTEDQLKVTLMDIINGIIIYPGMTIIHNCCDDQQGIADLIGVNIDEDDK